MDLTTISFSSNIIHIFRLGLLQNVYTEIILESTVHNSVFMFKPPVILTDRSNAVLLMWLSLECYCCPSRCCLHLLCVKIILHSV